MKKQLLGFLFSGLMVCFAFHSAVWAAAETIMNGEGKTTDLTWEFTNGELTIGGEGAIPDYSDAADRPWNNATANITKLAIGNGVTAIGANARGHRS